MKLFRYKKNAKAVLGILKDDEYGTYHTLENAETVIPDGIYTVIVNHSPAFGKDLPLLISDKVPASRGIRIHEGNYSKDSKGCILVGNDSYLERSSIGGSTKAMEQLLKNCGDRLEIITIA